jgi:tetratricopeptide (TPR) repeat protein
MHAVYHQKYKPIETDQLDKAQEVLKQIKIDGDMVSLYHKERNSLKSLSLNTEAYCLQRQKKYVEALKCLEEAENYENDSDIIESARTKLSKSVVMSHLGKYIRSHSETWRRSS